MKNWFEEIAWRLLLLLFLYTALSKLMNFQEFFGQMNNQVFDNRFTPALTYGIPAVEIVASILLLFKPVRPAGFWASAILMLAFTVYVALIIFNYFPRVPCACASGFENLSWPQHLVMNLLFLAIAIVGILLHKNPGTALGQGNFKNKSEINTQHPYTDKNTFTGPITRRPGHKDHAGLSGHT